MTTDHTPPAEQAESARALLWRHGLPEDIIDGALCLHAQELAAVQRAAIAKTDDPVFYEGEAGWLVDLIDPTRADEHPAPPADPLPPADQAALRDRIAEALAREDAHNAGYDHGFVASYGADDETDGFVDAVLAVLPPPVSRADERLARVREWVTSDVVTARSSFGDGYREAQRDIRDLLDGRRMADEAWDVPDARPGTTDHTLTQPEPAVTVHACPGLDDNGISPCCKRPPFEFQGERLTRDPALVTCPGPTAETQQDGARS